MRTHSNLSYRTSQVSNAGDSTKQHNKQDTGVGSDCWFGRFILREETALRTSRDCFRRRVQYQQGRPTHFLRLEARRLQQFWFDVRTETVIAAKCLVPALGILGFRLCLVKLLRAVKRVLSFCSWVSSFFRRTVYYATRFSPYISGARWAVAAGKRRGRVMATIWQRRGWAASAECAACRDNHLTSPKTGGKT